MKCSQLKICKYNTYTLKTNCQTGFFSSLSNDALAICSAKRSAFASFSSRIVEAFLMETPSDSSNLLKSS